MEVLRQYPQKTKFYERLRERSRIAQMVANFEHTLIASVLMSIASVYDNVALRIGGIAFVAIGIFMLMLPFVVMIKFILGKFPSIRIKFWRLWTWNDVERLYDKWIAGFDFVSSKLRCGFRIVVRVGIYLVFAWLLIEAFHWFSLTWGLGDVRIQGESWRCLRDNFKDICSGAKFSRYWPITVVVWTVFLDVLSVFCRCLAHCALAIIRAWRKQKKGAVQCNTVIPDVPIAPDDKDLLGRGEYVNVVASLIRGAKVGESARYIGLYGTWGEGKTSVIPRIQRALRYEGYSFVDFRLWEYADRKNLPQLLFNAIASQERLRLDRTLAGLFRSFGRSLVSSSSALADIPIAGGVIAGLYEHISSPEKIKEDLRQALIRHTNKIVVVLDDLDRLLADDIYELIRLIKANGDLPNVIYLVSADREYLASALASKLPTRTSEQEQLEEGRRYLEKIIPVECNLPIVKEARYVGLFKFMLGQEIAFPSDFDLKKYSGDLIAPYLLTMRNVKRLVNAVYVQWMYQCTKSAGARPKINIGDMIALTAVKVFARPLYESLRKNFYLIQSTVRRSGKPSSKGLSKEWVEANLLGGCSIEYRSALLVFMAEALRFKECENVISRESENHDAARTFASSAYFFFPPDDSEKEFRLVSPKYFWNYFTSENESAEPPSVDIGNQFIQLLENEDEAAEYLIALQAAHKLKPIQKGFYRLLDVGMDSDIVEKSIIAVSRAIEKVSVGLADWNFEYALQSDFGNPAAAQLFRMLPRCLKKLSSRDKAKVKSDVIANSLKKSNSLGTISRIIVLYGGRNNKFSEVAFLGLREYFKGEVESLIKKERMVGYPDELVIRKAWICLAISDSVFGRHVAEVLLDEARIVGSRWNALYPFIKATKSMRAEHIACFTADWLTKIFELHQLVELSKIIRSGEMTTSWDKALAYSIEYILDNNCSENKISRANQEEYIRKQLAAAKDM